MNKGLEQQSKIKQYKTGEIVKHKGFGNSPKKYFKILSIDEQWGVVDYGPDTIGIAYIDKTNIFEKIIWLLFYR